MTDPYYDVAVIGGGVSGMATAARLQTAGLSTVVLEQHDHVGGCAGYYEVDDFAFDVGATTLVEFHSEGIGGRLLADLGFEPPAMELQDAYRVWLPDCTVTLYRDHDRWRRERRRVFGDDERHRAFFRFFDDLTDRLWRLVRSDVKLPIQSVRDVVRNARAVGLGDLGLARYLRWTMADALRAFDVYDDRRLRSTLALLVEDTVHSTLDAAPLPNAALGATIHRTGIARPTGGMAGFWNSFERQYVDAGGTVATGTTVREVTGSKGEFVLAVDRDRESEGTTGASGASADARWDGTDPDDRIPAADGAGDRDRASTGSPDRIHADQVVSTVPVTVTARLAPDVVEDRLATHVQTVREHEGGACVVFLGVPGSDVEGQQYTHHQLLADYDEPLGDGNNMFVSVSAAGDDESAPPGHRAVMLSTHCDVEDWQDLDEDSYEREKAAIGDRLVRNARRVYPDLATDPVVYEVGTPITYEAFTKRPRGAIGGYRQTKRNTNQRAIPQDVGVEGFYLAGDTTWPGLGTVACVKGSRIAAEHVLEGA